MNGPKRSSPSRSACSAAGVSSVRGGCCIPASSDRRGAGTRPRVAGGLLPRPTAAMRLTRLESHLLRLPLARPITPPDDARRGPALDHVFALLVHLDTDAGHRGFGFAYAMQGGGRALKAVADDDLAPLVVGED